MATEFPEVKYGVAVPASETDKKHDDTGFTNPNLHRRINPHSPSDPREVAPREYTLGIYDLDSYRTTKINYHDEESTTSEIP